MTRPLRLHVYNHEYNVTREVSIQPSRNWGGTGALGCVLGFGALHRIPSPLDEPPQAPGETLFETARLSSDSARDAPNTPQYLVPAETPSLAPRRTSSSSDGPPPGPSQHGRRGNRPHHNVAKAGDIDAYFAEGEAKSKEQDKGGGAESKKAEGLAPPPPKSGGPPKIGSPLKETTSAAAAGEPKEVDDSVD